MTFHGYLCFAGTETINSARAGAYASLHGLTVQCTGCDGLAEALEGDGFGGYRNPKDDQAPWFDPNVPASRGFWGVLGLEVTGGSASTASTGWTDLLGDGATSGPLRRAAREVGLRVLLLARDDASLSYGLAWLASALRGSQCRGCGGDELEMFAACPDTSRPFEKRDLCGTGNDTGVWPWPDSGWKRGMNLARTLYDVALLEGPEMVARQTWPGGVTVEAEFTLKAGTPYWYHEPVTVASTATTPKTAPTWWQDHDPSFDTNTAWDACAARQPEQSQSCLTDPENPLQDCVPLPPPPIPQPPPDPCYPGGSYDPYGAWRTFIQIPPQGLSEWLEKVPVITISPGHTPLRRVVVRWWSNPLQQPAGPDRDPCLLCAELIVAYLPENSRFILDGRIQRGTVECGGDTYADPVLYGPQGAVYTWPTLDCTTAMVLEISVDGRWPLAEDWQFEVQLVEREDAN